MYHHEALLIVFAVYSFVREFISIVFGAPISAVAEPTYLLFNLIVLISLSTMISYNQDDNKESSIILIKHISLGSTVAIFVALIGCLYSGVQFYGGNVSARATGFFNNPNQLGYFALCTQGIFLVLRYSGLISLSRSLVLIIITTFLVFLSLSKAAIIGSLFATLIFSLSERGSRTLMMFVAPALPLVAAIISFSDSSIFSRLHAFQRISSIGSQGDDSLEARGYLIHRFFDSFFDYLFGIGSRGVLDHLGHEIHSTIFSPFGSYGSIGFILFLTALILWFYKCTCLFGFLKTSSIIVPLMLYGVAHNGTRFTVLYLLIFLSLRCGSTFLSKER